jgi:hypothetical protein
MKCKRIKNLFIARKTIGVTSIHTNSFCVINY